MFYEIVEKWIARLQQYNSWAWEVVTENINIRNLEVQNYFEFTKISCQIKRNGQHIQARSHGECVWKAD